MLSFQKMDVYRCANEFLGVANELSSRLPAGYGPLADQLRRAALSIPLNIAEGAGRTSKRDAAKHYGIARGSAMECAAIVDAFATLALASERDLRQPSELLTRLVAMLTRLCL